MSEWTDDSVHLLPKIGKAFLQGEYLALDGLPALILTYGIDPLQSAWGQGSSANGYLRSLRETNPELFKKGPRFLNQEDENLLCDFDRNYHENRGYLQLGSRYDVFSIWQRMTESKGHPSGVFFKIQGVFPKIRILPIQLPVLSGKLCLIKAPAREKVKTHEVLSQGPQRFLKMANDFKDRDLSFDHILSHRFHLDVTQKEISIYRKNHCVSELSDRRMHALWGLGIWARGSGAEFQDLMWVLVQSRDQLQSILKMPEFEDCECIYEYSAQEQVGTK